MFDRIFKALCLVIFALVAFFGIGAYYQVEMAKATTNASPEAVIAEVEQGPYVTLTTDGKVFTYEVGADGSIWMDGDEGLELWKQYGGTATLTVPNGYEVQVHASAGTVSGPLGSCALGNPISCNGYYWLDAGTYTFNTYGKNDSAGIKVDVREE